MTPNPRKLEISVESLDEIMQKRAIGKRIKEAREQAGLSQAALGKILGTSSSAVGQWEIGGTRPAPKKFIALAGVLKVTVDWLLTGGQEPERLMAQTTLEQEALANFRELPTDAQEAVVQLIKAQREKVPGKPGRRKQQTDGRFPSFPAHQGRKKGADSPSWRGGVAM